MKKIENYKTMIERLDAFFASKKDERSEWTLTYNDQHGCYETAKSEYDDSNNPKLDYFGVMKYATWVHGEDDKKRAAEEDRIWEFQLAGVSEDKPFQAWAASTLLGLLTGMEFEVGEDSQAINELEDKLLSLLVGQWTDLGFTSRTHKLTDSIPPCESFEELLQLNEIHEDEFNSPEEYERFKQTHTEIEFTWYPNTPVGCHTVRGVELYSVISAVFE